jgi:hypothetical protein
MMIMKPYFWLCLVLLLVLAGCNGPQFVNHPRPDFKVDFTVFEDVGCPPVGKYGEYSARRCEADSPLLALGCDAIRKDLALDGLEPAYPIAECIVSPDYAAEPLAVTEQMFAEGQYLFIEGDARPNFIRYVIFRDDNFELVATKDEFRSIFAPITTPAEALSYAKVLKHKLAGFYNLAYDPEYEYFVDAIEDTHVEEIARGYLVYLFTYDKLGCEPHIVETVVVEVTTDGIVREINREDIYQAPPEDDCVEEEF